MSEPRKYRKKPVTIEAMQWDGTPRSTADIRAWAEESSGVNVHYPQPDTLLIETLEGGMKASVGDYIIRGVQGEFYPCKPDIFAATYEEAPNE